MADWRSAAPVVQAVVPVAGAAQSAVSVVSAVGRLEVLVGAINYVLIVWESIVPLRVS